MNNETIKADAKQLFKTTVYDVLYANAKGEFFTSKNLAQPTLKKGETLQKFERSEFPDTAEAKDGKGPNAQESIELINKATAVEELAPFASDERKTVKAAYDAKLVELSGGAK